MVRAWHRDMLAPMDLDVTIVGAGETQPYFVEMTWPDHRHKGAIQIMAPACTTPKGLRTPSVTCMRQIECSSVNSST